MSEILGYGEDAFTFWALKHRLSSILDHFDDETNLSDCLIFYRPSFGRHSKEGAAIFGEFDAIIGSLENIYLIESKWDNLIGFKEEELTLRKEQIIRHQIFSWYLTHWDTKYVNKWTDFEIEHRPSFNFKGKKIAPPNSVLAANLEFILSRLLQCCRKLPTENNIKNVLLFFYKGGSKPAFKVDRSFELVPIEYGQEISANFISLSS